MSTRKFIGMTKREKQISCHCTLEDYELFRKAAKVLSPDVPISDSTLLLVLAKRGAEDVLRKKKS